MLIWLKYESEKYESLKTIIYYLILILYFISPKISQAKVWRLNNDIKEMNEI